MRSECSCPGSFTHTLSQELQANFKLAKAGQCTKDGKKINPDTLANRIEKKKQQIEKFEINAKVD